MCLSSDRTVSSEHLRRSSESCVSVKRLRPRGILEFSLVSALSHPIASIVLTRPLHFKHQELWVTFEYLIFFSYWNGKILKSLRKTKIFYFVVVWWVYIIKCSPLIQNFGAKTFVCFRKFNTFKSMDMYFQIFNIPSQKFKSAIYILWGTFYWASRVSFHFCREFYREKDPLLLFLKEQTRMILSIGI